MIEGGKRPNAIARQDGKPLAAAGIWESFRGRDCASQLRHHDHNTQH
jgi:putative SOS response-associated peptidase YedK